LFWFRTLIFWRDRFDGLMDKLTLWQQLLKSPLEAIPFRLRFHPATDISLRGLFQASDPRDKYILSEGFVGVSRPTPLGYLCRFLISRLESASLGQV
jgi:hypothetical protein